MADITNKKKILYIIPQLNIGGAELQLLKLIKGLNKEKYDIYLCNLEKNANKLEDEFKAMGAMIIPIHKKDKFDVDIVFRLAKFIRENKIDIVHSFLNNLWSRLACLKVSNKPLVITSERSIDTWWKKSYHFWLDKFLLKSTDYVTCNSNEIKEFYIDKLKCSREEIEKFKVIYNAIEVEDKGESLELRRKLRIRYNIDENNICFGIIASLRPVKNHLMILKAIKRLKSDGIDNFKVFFIGDGVLREELREKASEMGIEEKVIFTGNIIPSVNIIPVLDFGLSTSIQEGLSNSIIELIAYGKPVIATKVGGNIELVYPGENGFFVDSDDYNSLYEYMKKLILNPKTIELTEEYIKNFRSKFDFSSMIRAYEELYNKR